MTRTMTTIGMIAALMVPAVAGAQSLPRTAGGGPDGGAKGPAPVQVPRYPYAGTWEGSVAIEGTPAPINVAMKFTVADGARQSYAGETTIEGRSALTHTNISAAPLAESRNSAAAPPMLRRSAGAAETGSGPSAGAVPDRDILAAGDYALLLYHSPTKTMALCDEGHRCIGLATLTWDEQGADGTKYSYSASLVEANTLKGTVVVTKNSSSATGTFTLNRKK